jgi:glycosyltransferase involved in cell wall biosynthesis
MPTYNEEAGIADYIREIALHVRPHVETLSFVVVDDVSTDGTIAAVAELAGVDGLAVEVVRAAANRGHGPTALEAWARGLALAPDLVLHVDGDGQFLGEDFPPLIAAAEGVDGVHGVRSDRSDPWFRRALSGMVRVLVLVVAGRWVRDVNTPLRAYRPQALRALLDKVPADAAVPHVHFSIMEKRVGLSIRETRARSIPRRGTSATGTMWGPTSSAPKVPPRSLVRFAARALREVVRIDILRGPTG